MQNSELAYMIALSKVKGIGDVALSKILFKYGSPKSIFNLEFEQSTPWEKRVANAIQAGAVQSELEEGKWAVERLKSLGGRAYTVLDNEYPLGLHQLDKAPPILYVLGELRQSDNYAVAVVGTRRPSKRGMEKARKLARALVRCRTIVISGLALGIDTSAHRGAISLGGRTIAVIGSGLDVRYPPQNSKLWDEILSTDGAIVSQFPPGTDPMKWTFPQRNWTMSGMAQGTIVVEASEGSGARLQAEFAAKQGRRLFLTVNQVNSFDWAKAIAAEDKAIVVHSVTDIIDVLVPTNELSQVPENLKVVQSMI